MNERAQGARAGDTASTRIQGYAETELCRELAIAFMGRVYRHSLLPPTTIQSFRHKQHL